MRQLDHDFKFVVVLLLVIIGICVALLLIATPSKASLKLTQTWEWHESPGATSYRVYWSASGKAWCSNNGLEFPASVCVNGLCQGDISLPSYSVFIMVTALNSAGESPTDHGPMTVCLTNSAYVMPPISQPLAVVRHLAPDGSVCLMVSGIDLTARFLQYRSVPVEAFSGSNSIPPDSEMYCIPGWTRSTGTKFIEVRQCYPGPPNSSGSPHADCEVTWYREPLCCDPLQPGNCPGDLYPECAP